MPKHKMDPSTTPWTPKPILPSFSTAWEALPEWKHEASFFKSDLRAKGVASVLMDNASAGLDSARAVSFLAAKSPWGNTVWIRAEDQFGNRDSTSIKIFNYSHVVFVRKNATGTGKSWEEAYGEIYQAMDSAKTYPVGTEIWVTKGSYGASPSYPSGLPAYHSDLKIKGGFYADRPSLDSTQRDFSAAAAMIATKFLIGENSVVIHDLVLDGFTMQEGLWIANSDHYRNTFRNLKFDQVTTSQVILLTRGYNNIFDKCSFTNLFSMGEAVMRLRGGNEFRNCRFENNKSGVDVYSPINLGSSNIVIRDCYFSKSKGVSGSYHFNLDYEGQHLDIDSSQIQGGIDSIRIDSFFPAGHFLFGTHNSRF